MNQICKKCSENFEITDDEADFYKKMGFNLPNCCVNCRYKQRLVFRNERKLYKRKCNATQKDIISIFSEDKSVPVYSQEYWWSDAWDAKNFGMDFDFTRPFFEQFKELLFKVPQLALNNSESENSEYTNQSQRNKNCYMLISSNFNEDCYYGMWFQVSKNCVDCLYLEKSELCYELVNCGNCYRCTFSQNLENCSDLHYSKNCIGCKNCFGCINLRNKEYHIFNEAYSKEEYFVKVKNLKIDENQLENFFSKFPRKYYEGKNIENSTGDYIQQLKNSTCVYNCKKCENIKYCYDSWDARNCLDMTETLQNDFCLEVEGCIFNVDLAFGMKCCWVSLSRYCSHCFYSKNLLGCVGLKNAEYCILNKQYSKEDYEKLSLRVIEHMKRTCEWGEYFPKDLSFFGYNETVANEYFPLTKDAAIKSAYKWHGDIIKKPDPSPDIYICKSCQKTYKLISQELKFYEQLSLPYPNYCSECRHQKRMSQRNPRRLWDRSCAKCGAVIQTSYSPDRPEIVYCESCYLATVY